MIFDFSDDVFESEKERNLYYKFFAGYFFNEMISGYKDRLKGFVDLLHESRTVELGWTHKIPEITLSPDSTHVSFDNHIYLLGLNAFGKGKQDRGEFADIIVHDRINEVLVAIEVKYLSDWSLEKDIKDNAGRLKAMKEKMFDTDIIHCLLVTRTKWDHVKRMVNHPNSSLKDLRKEAYNPFVVLTWDQFFPICQHKHEKARRYLEYRIGLKIDTAHYEIEDGVIKKAQ